MVLKVTRYISENNKLTKLGGYFYPLFILKKKFKTLSEHSFTVVTKLHKQRDVSVVTKLEIRRLEAIKRSSSVLVSKAVYCVCGVLLLHA